MKIIVIWLNYSELLYYCAIFCALLLPLTLDHPYTSTGPLY